MARFLDRKDKQKKKAESSIEFVSPYPLEDCVWQLQNFPGVGEWFPIKTRVEVSQINDKTWTFKIHKTYFNVSSYNSRSKEAAVYYFKVQAEGRLRQTADMTTLVVGKTYISKESLIINTIIALLSLAVIMVILITLNFSAQSIFFSFVVTVGFLIPSFAGIFLSGKIRFIYVLKDHLTRVLGR